MSYYIAYLEFQLVDGSNDYFDIHAVMNNCGFTNTMIDSKSGKQCPLPFNTYFFDETYPRNAGRFQTLDEVHETLNKALEKLKYESGRYIIDNHKPSRCFVAKIDASDVSKECARIFSV